MELKLAHEHVRIDNKPSFLFFLELRKTYNTVDRNRLTQTL